jgi:hypothetical protein
MGAPGARNSVEYVGLRVRGSELISELASHNVCKPVPEATRGGINSCMRAVDLIEYQYKCYSERDTVPTYTYARLS